MAEIVPDWGPRVGKEARQGAETQVVAILPPRLPECRGYGNRMCTADPLAAAIARRHRLADTKVRQER
jgi:hypothetical protein